MRPRQSTLPLSHPDEETSSFLPKVRGTAGDGKPTFPCPTCRRESPGWRTLLFAPSRNLTGGGVPRDVVMGEKLVVSLPECGNIIITSGWVLEYETENEGPALAMASETGRRGAVRQENRDYLARIVSVAPHMASANVTGVVRYAREPVPCPSYPVGDSPDWNTFGGEEHHVAFMFEMTQDGAKRSLRRADDADDGGISWKPVNDTDLQELEAHVRRLGAAARRSQKIKMVSKGLDDLRGRVQDMLQDIATMQAKVLELDSPGNVEHDDLNE